MFFVPFWATHSVSGLTAKKFDAQLSRTMLVRSEESHAWTCLPALQPNC